MTWTLPKDLPNLAAAKRISLDTETHDPDLKEKGPGIRRDGYMVGISVGTDDGGRWYLPFSHAEGKQFDKKNIIAWAKDNLTRPNQPKVGANLLYDLDYLEQAGVKVSGPFYDVQVAEPLLDETLFSYSLDTLSNKYLGIGKDSTLLKQACLARGWKGEPRAHIWKLPAELVGEYGEGDVDRPLKVLDAQMKLLQQDDLLGIFDLETRLIPMILKMRRQGVRVNIKGAEQARTVARSKLVEIKKQLKILTGVEVEIWASDSVAKVFDKAGIKYPNTAKTQKPSITKLYLEGLGHPLAKLIQEARKLDKFVGTFLEGSILNEAIKGRIHCQFHQLKGDENGTITGRFSSSNPNLQFMPARDGELGPLIRGIFIPEAGHLWGRADYSQIEYRLLAHFAIGEGADVIRQKYNDDPATDYHQMCAELAQIPRTPAKTVNFMVVYGGGIDKTAEKLGLTKEKAAEFLERYHATLPFIKNTSRVASRRAEDRGFIKTILGRRGRFNLWEPADFKLSRGFKAKQDKCEVLAIVAEEISRAVKAGQEAPRSGVHRAGTYKALNKVLQGSSADITKKAMVDIFESGLDQICPVHITVHDELDVSVPKNKKGREAFSAIVKAMENTVKLSVPIRVDSLVGKNWGECK